MALTNPQKIALRDWLQANIHKAVHTVTYHEGVKQTVQVTDPLSGATLDKEVPVMVQGRRDYIERTMDMIDWQEVIVRVQAKVAKYGYVGVSEDQIEDLLREYRATIKSWIPGVSWGGSNPAGRKAALTEDPDV